MEAALFFSVFVTGFSLGLLSLFLIVSIAIKLDDRKKERQSAEQFEDNFS